MARQSVTFPCGQAAPHEELLELANVVEALAEAQAAFDPAAAAAIDLAVWQCQVAEIDALLARAVAQPTLGAVAYAPPDVEVRAMDFCKTALQAVVHEYGQRAVNAEKADRASRWCWILPTLLLRPADKGDEQQEREAHAQDTSQASSKFSFAKLLRKRLQKAETAQWKELLVEYLAAVQAKEDRADSLYARNAPPAGDDDAAYAKVIEQVTSDGVSKSKHTLLRAPRPERTQETADAMAALCCEPVPPEEPERFTQELYAASTSQETPPKLKLRTLKPVSYTHTTLPTNREV